MIRKSVLEETGLNFDPNVTASEEYCLFMQLASKYPFGVSKKIMAQYRVHNESLTSKSLAMCSKERRYTLNLILQNNPKLIIKYKNAFKEAFARADYYDARWLMSKNNNYQAFKMLIFNSFIDIKYLFLAFLVLIPFNFWDKIHLLKRNRV